MVEIPQFVADFIEDEKGELKLYGAFHEIDECYGAGAKLYDWVFASEDSQELFARAWLDGYTVKKEQLYVLEFTKQLNAFVSSTGKNQDNDVIISGYTSVKKDAERFTESEIKAIDERYWPFAVKVDEVEP